MRAAVELRQAGVRLGAVPVLEGVDLVVADGERVAVVGPSGAGKTTLLRLLNGTVRPASGTVRVLGCALADASPPALATVRREIGTVHQDLALVDHLRVVHNVSAGRLGGWPLWKAALSLLRPQEIDTARAALRRVGLEGHLHERTDRLSGGERQRVAIARLLVQRPRLVLADEPIASLDPRLGREVVDLLLAAAGDSGATVVASLHDAAVALERFDRIVGLRGGRVVFDLAPGAVDRHALGALYAAEEGAAR